MLSDYHIETQYHVIKEWYDGYSFDEIGSIYSPRSVIEATLSGVCDSYWNQTETFEALQIYIDMNYEGLKDDVLSMIAGEKVSVNTGSFTNDMTTFNSKDDVLTLLIHLGYLAYDFSDKQVYIPNGEVKGAINQIKNKQYFESLKEYQGNLLLVGINCDKQTREHQCVIEEFQK